MPEDMSEVHTIGTAQVYSFEQSLLKAVDAFEHETDVVVFLRVWVAVRPESFLISGQRAIGERLCRSAAHAQVEGHKAVVAHIYLPVVVIDGRPVERVAYHLPPVLPARVDIMIVIIVYSPDVVGYGLRVVVVYRATLILGVHIFEDDVAQPARVFEVEFRSEQHILHVVYEIATLFLHLPLLPQVPPS